MKRFEIIKDFGLNGKKKLLLVKDKDKSTYCCMTGDMRPAQQSIREYKNEWSSWCSKNYEKKLKELCALKEDLVILDDGTVARTLIHSLEEVSLEEAVNMLMSRKASAKTLKIFVECIPDLKPFLAAALL